MSKLVCHLTDLDGTVLTALTDFEGLQVTIPLNDSRTAKVKTSVYNPQIGLGGTNIRPGDRMLKCFFNGHLVFWGIITIPDWQGAEHTVEINAHDPTLKLKHHYFDYGDAAVGTRTDGGYSMDAGGARDLMYAAEISDAELARGVKPLGIRTGLWRTHRELRRPDDLENPHSGDGFWRTVERGANVWTSLQDIMAAVEGFDIEFEPIDADHPQHWSHPVYMGNAPQALPWVPGVYAQINCYEKQGRDRTVEGDTDDPIVFFFGKGPDNLDDFNFKPDADAMRNYAVQVYAGGQRNSGDKARSAWAKVEDSWRRYGIYGSWESAGQKDSQKVLLAKAQAVVGAYGYPLPFFTARPKADQREGHWSYGTDFFVGDRCTFVAASGYMQAGWPQLPTMPISHISGRIMKVTLTQDDVDANCHTDLDCVPSIIGTAGEITPTPT